MRGLAPSLRLLALLAVVLLSTSGCLSNKSPFTSAAFPTPQAPLFTSAGYQPRSLMPEEPGGEFTLVAFERMVSQGGNQSDINIDLSRSPQPVERYLFVIDRSKHSVTVLSADAQDIPEDLGDIHARLTLELTDPVAFAGYVTPDSTVFQFAVQYVPGFVRIVDVTTQADAVLELTDLTEGTQSTLIQTQLAGLTATLDVDVLDLERDDDDGLEEDVGPISRQDKPQQPLSLGQNSAGGSVNVIVTLEDEAPPVAVLPPPTEDITQPEPDEEIPPSDNQPPPQQPPDPPPEGDGDNDEESSEDEEPPADSETPPSSATPLPTDPDGEDSISDSIGGDPTEPNLDIVIVIDDSSNMRTDDPFDERLEAVRAFFNATLEGDRVALVRFSDSIYLRRLTSIIHLGGGQTDGGIKRLRGDLDLEPDLTTGLTPSHLGLIAACDELNENGAISNRMAILISDGASNVGVDRSGHFDPVEKCFNDRGWPIFTVGIGNYREDTLDALANNTGGDSRYVPPDEMAFLACDVQAIRADYASGTVLPCRDDLALPSKTIAFSINVPAAQMRASFNLNWLGSENDIELRLVRPNGKIVAGRVQRPDDVSFDGGTRSETTLEAYSIDLPEAGTWGVQIISKVVPEEGTQVVFGFSSVPAR